jgi:esterase/lipase superfamily enzyme
MKLLVTLLNILLACSFCKAADTLEVSPSKTIEGELVHDVKSSYQSGPTEIRVLLPEQLTKAKRYKVIYVLPVEAGRENRYGDGLSEIKKLNLHNQHQVIFVAPTFADLPWYANHPTDLKIRQDSYFVDVVVPYIDKTYPTCNEASGRMLLGFSKSGWGAWSLLLRHPTLFQKAVAWDAPMMMSKPGLYGSGPIFGNVSNFEHYQISRLVLDHAGILNATVPRLILIGQGNFQAEHTAIHQLMTDSKIPHIYRDGIVRKHNWHSGWVCEAIELLLH